MKPAPLWASLAADKYHGSRRRHKTRLVDAMTFFLFVHHRTDVNAEILVTGIFAQQGAQVMILFAKEAGTKLAVGGQPDTRTVSAKGLGNRRDQADLAPRAVRETILARCLARLVGNLHQRPAGMNSIKRMITPRSRANWANDRTSSSLKPRTSTAFTFTGPSR